MKALAAGVCLLFASPALAAECTLAHATYGQAGTGFSLQFRPITPDDGLMATNAFDLLVPASDKRVAGLVQWGNGFARPIGTLMYGCPAEADYVQQQACTHWSGIIYAATGSEIDVLPDETEPAPEQLILANLGQELRYSNLFALLMEEIADPPWDIFQLRDCQ